MLNEMSLILSWVNLEKHSQTLLKETMGLIIKNHCSFARKKKVKILAYKRERVGGV